MIRIVDFTKLLSFQSKSTRVAGPNISIAALTGINEHVARRFCNPLKCELEHSSLILYWIRSRVTALLTRSSNYDLMMCLPGTSPFPVWAVIYYFLFSCKLSIVSNSGFRKINTKYRYWILSVY